MASFSVSGSPELSPQGMPLEATQSSLKMLSDKISSLKLLQGDLVATLTATTGPKVHVIDHFKERLLEHNVLAPQEKKGRMFVVEALQHVSEEIGRIEAHHSSLTDIKPMEIEESLGTSQKGTKRHEDIDSIRSRKRPVVDEEEVDLPPMTELLSMDYPLLVETLRHLSFSALMNGPGRTNRVLREAALEAAKRNENEGASAAIQFFLDKLEKIATQPPGKYEPVHKKLLELSQTIPDRLQGCQNFVSIHQTMTTIRSEFAKILAEVGEEDLQALLKAYEPFPKSHLFLNFGKFVTLQVVLEKVKNAAPDEREDLSYSALPTLSYDIRAASLGGSLSDYQQECVEQILQHGLVLSDEDLEQLAIVVLKFKRDLALQLAQMLPEGSDFRSGFYEELVRTLDSKEFREKITIYSKEIRSDSTLLVEIIKKLLSLPVCDLEAALKISEDHDQAGMDVIIKYVLDRGDLQEAERLVKSLDMNSLVYNKMMATLAVAHIRSHNRDKVLWCIEHITDFESGLESELEDIRTALLESTEEAWEETTLKVAEVLGTREQYGMRDKLLDSINKKLIENVTKLLHDFDLAPNYDIVDNLLQVVEKLSNMKDKTSALFQICKSLRTVGNVTRFIDVVEKIHMSSLSHDDQMVMTRMFQELKDIHGASPENKFKFKKLYVLLTLPTDGGIDRAYNFVRDLFDINEKSQLLDLIVTKLFDMRTPLDRVIHIAQSIPDQAMRSKALVEIFEGYSYGLEIPRAPIQNRLILLRELKGCALSLPDGEEKDKELYKLCVFGSDLGKDLVERLTPREEVDHLIEDIQTMAEGIKGTLESQNVQRIVAFLKMKRIYVSLDDGSDQEKLEAARYAIHEIDRACPDSETRTAAQEFEQGIKRLEEQQRTS